MALKYHVELIHCIYTSNLFGISQVSSCILIIIYILIHLFVLYMLIKHLFHVFYIDGCFNFEYFQRVSCCVSTISNGFAFCVQYWLFVIILY